MISFKDWLLSQESSPTTRSLNAPWAYPALYVGGNPFADTNSPQTLKNYKKMIKRDTKKKRKKKDKKPDTSLDNFVKEIDLLKQDIDRLTVKKKKDQESSHEKPKKPVKAEVNDDLVQTAKVVLSNLKSAPNYYSKRVQVDRLVGSREPITKKVSRQDAIKVAKQLGIDFSKTKFTPEGFRKGVESEIHRQDLPSLVQRLGDADIRSSVDDDRMDRGN